MTLLLVRQRPPPTGAIVLHEVGAAAVALPSGLLAMIGEAITKLESQLPARPASLGVIYVYRYIYVHICRRSGPRQRQRR